jgi:23S rRNA-/tRNA-specific pseudouridylate synthase
LLFAKQSHVAGILSKAFREHRIVKYYVALSNKTPKKKSQGYITGIQERGRRKSWMLLPPTKNATLSTVKIPSHYAKTRFFTAGLGQFVPSNASITEAFPLPRTLLLLRPYTGQTHQLRVAMKSVGLPILGDPIYSTAKSLGHRCYLHATAIHIPAEIVQQFRHDALFRNDDAVANEMHGRNITIYCPPPFASAWRPEPEDDDASVAPPWRPILHRLMRQHCAVDCPELLSMIHDDI